MNHPSTNSGDGMTIQDLPVFEVGLTYLRRDGGTARFLGKLDGGSVRNPKLAWAYQHIEGRSQSDSIKLTDIDGRYAPDAAAWPVGHDYDIIPSAVVNPTKITRRWGAVHLGNFQGVFGPMVFGPMYASKEQAAEDSKDIAAVIGFCEFPETLVIHSL